MTEQLEGSESLIQSLTQDEKEILAEIDNRREIEPVDNILAIFNWLNALRLALSRLSRITTYYGRVILPKLFRFFGLTFIAEIAIDIGVSYHEARRAEDKPARFKQMLFKDARLYRMANAIVWLSINSAVFFVAPQTALILNIMGFSFDVMHEFFWLARKSQKYRNLLSKVSQEIRQTDFSSPKHAELIKLKVSIEKKRNDVFAERAYTFTVVSFVLVGMAFILFPASPVSPLIGGTITFLIGSTVGGLGRKVWKKGWEWAEQWKNTNKMPSMPYKVENPDDTLSVTTAPQPGTHIPAAENTHPSIIRRLSQSQRSPSENDFSASTVDPENSINSLSQSGALSRSTPFDNPADSRATSAHLAQGYFHSRSTGSLAQLADRSKKEPRVFSPSLK